MTSYISVEVINSYTGEIEHLKYYENIDIHEPDRIMGWNRHSDGTYECEVITIDLSKSWVTIQSVII